MTNLHCQSERPQLVAGILAYVRHIGVMTDVLLSIRYADAGLGACGRQASELHHVDFAAYGTPLLRWMRIHIISHGAAAAVRNWRVLCVSEAGREEC